jgi:hypothetical protein
MYKGYTFVHRWHTFTFISSFLTLSLGDAASHPRRTKKTEPHWKPKNYWFFSSISRLFTIIMAYFIWGISTAVMITLTFQSQLITWCISRFNIKQFYFLHAVFVCFVLIWEQRPICAPYNLNWFVLITEMKSVYSAVQTGSLNKAVCASSLKG